MRWWDLVKYGMARNQMTTKNGGRPNWHVMIQAGTLRSVEEEMWKGDRTCDQISTAMLTHSSRYLSPQFLARLQHRFLVLSSNRAACWNNRSLSRCEPWPHFRWTPTMTNCTNEKQHNWYYFVGLYRRIAITKRAMTLSSHKSQRRWACGTMWPK